MSAAHSKKAKGVTDRSDVYWPVAVNRPRAHPVHMSNYAAIDAIIDACVKATGSTLFTEWAGAPARFFHIPGDAPFECFQVSVRTPENGRTAVTARAIDTNDNTEEAMDQTWEGTFAQLNDMLGTALTTIERWKTRERTKPDPAPPW
mgnify:CR=1 FL=1